MNDYNFSKAPSFLAKYKQQDLTKYIYIYDSGGKQKQVYTSGNCFRTCGYTVVRSAKNDVFDINEDLTWAISGCLEEGCDMTLEYATSIRVNANIAWNSNHNLILISQHDITLSKGVIIYNNGTGTLKLMSGMENRQGTGIVIFEEGANIQALNRGSVEIYFHPFDQPASRKYHFYYFLDVQPMIALTEYMLVNNVVGLQNIKYFLHGNYALSQDIDANDTAFWNNGLGFDPLYYNKREVPFSGNFDGNGYTIRNLHINRPSEEAVGLFKIMIGSSQCHLQIKNLILDNADITGDHYVGVLAGSAVRIDLTDISIINSKVRCRDVAGGAFGNLLISILSPIYVENNTIEFIQEEFRCNGTIIGAAIDLEFTSDFNLSISETIGCYLNEN